jgi:hypothetical protein
LRIHYIQKQINLEKLIKIVRDRRKYSSNSIDGILKWNEFEEVVNSIIKNFERFRGTTILRNQRFLGIRQPGIYEIDIAAKISLENLVELFLIVGCKNWKRPVPRSVVHNVFHTKEALNAQKAIVVSHTGFTKQAIEVAESLGVVLWVIEKEEIKYEATPRINNEAEDRVIADSELGFFAEQFFSTIQSSLIRLILNPNFNPIGNNAIESFNRGYDWIVRKNRTDHNPREIEFEIASWIFNEIFQNNYDPSATFSNNELYAPIIRSQKQYVMNLGFSEKTADSLIQCALTSDLVQFKEIFASAYTRFSRSENNIVEESDL